MPRKPPRIEPNDDRLVGVGIGFDVVEYEIERGRLSRSPRTVERHDEPIGGTAAEDAVRELLGERAITETVVGRVDESAIG